MAGGSGPEEEENKKQILTVALLQYFMELSPNMANQSLPEILRVRSPGVDWNKRRRTFLSRVPSSARKIKTEREFPERAKHS